MSAIIMLMSFIAFALSVYLFWVVVSKTVKGKSTSTMFFVGGVFSVVLGIASLALKDNFAYAFLGAAVLWFTMAFRLRSTKPE